MREGAGRAPDPEERRRLFRKMEWVFVWGPPLLILFVGGSASAFLAWLVPIPGLGFWTKWLLGVLLIVGVPLLAYLIRAWWHR